MKTIFGLFTIFTFFVSATFAQISDLPPNPEPGKCYVRCVTPDVYETTTKRVMTKEGYKTYEFIPAQYKTVEEQVMVKEATKEFQYIPATYRTEMTTIEIEEPETEYNLVPVQFASKSEEIEVKPKTVKYEYQRSNNCSDPDGDCMTVCAIEEPAEYKTYVSQVISNAANYTANKVGGQTITVETKVIQTPARYEEIEIPAEYKTITKRILVKDAEVREIEVPAEYATETIRVMTQKGGMEKWEEVDCHLTQRNILPIYYELGSARLTSNSRRIIDQRLLALMQEKPYISVEIAAHTDARGSSYSNMSLSQKRAESVVSYLKQRGISKSRLIAKGYGESQLLNNCADGVDCPENMHQENRRTEFRVLD